MDIQTKAGDPELSGQVLLYTRPEPLNPDRHGRLGLTQVQEPFNFARAAHAVPVTVTEFSPASLSFPIIFTADFQPLAVMSIRQNENLFITDMGFFEFGAYVPAYIRRYPFVLANDQNTGQMLVCIERDAEAVKENGEVPLFEGDQPSVFTRGVIEFCSNFETERQRTVSFIDLLKPLDLFELKEQFYTPANPDGSSGERQKLAEFYGISETKLAALPADKLAQLRNNGALQQIYAHLISQGNWDKLVGRTLQRDGAITLPSKN